MLAAPGTLWKACTIFAEQAKKAVAYAATMVWKGLTESLPPMMRKLGGWISDTTKAVGNAFKDVAKSVIEALKAFPGAALSLGFAGWAGLKAAVATIGTAAKDFAKGAAIVWVLEGILTVFMTIALLIKMAVCAVTGACCDAKDKIEQPESG